jgi:dinuclear metal center YbgI/SA1388 family protein
VATTGNALSDTVGAWLDLVHELYPPSDALGWDRPGLQVGDPGWTVRRVLVSLDVTRAVLDEAASESGTLVLAHHPLLLEPLRDLTPSTASGSLALRAARASIAVAAAHTNLDAADDGAGTSDPVVELLALTRVLPLCAPAVPGARAMGRVGDLPAPMSLRALAELIATGLPAPSSRIIGPPERLVRRVAVLGGSGSSAAPDALAAGADVLVTGDVRHHAALDALELGLALIDAGHHATEVAAMPPFAANLRRAAAVAGLQAPVVLSSIDTTPWEPV